MLFRSVSEFQEDLRRLTYLQKLFGRYSEGELKERLILNHLIVLFNLFGIAAINILFYKIKTEYRISLITFLVYLDRMPNYIPQYHITLSDYELDQTILSVLGKI